MTEAKTPPPESHVPAYRFLVEGDVIEATDEFIGNDGQTWARPDGWEVGMEYPSHVFKSARRLVRPPPQDHLEGWTKVPEDLPHMLLKSINRDNQVLAYENGRYYNAWFEFEPSEGGWFWTDDADTEPNPSHYRMLREVALATTEGSDNG